MGGDKLSYEGPVSTPTADLTKSKLHWNSVVSTPDGKYLIADDVNNFYLNNLMKKSEYLKIALKIIPQEIIDKYDLLNKQCDGYIYVRIEKGIYGLMQAGIIAHESLKEHLKPYGYALANITQGLQRHTDRDINFTLVVDNFGIKYRHKKDADHLISELQTKYEVTQDWTGGLYCGMKLKWDYKTRQLATHPETITRYHASGMTVRMHSDASFLLAPGEKSRAGGYHYLSERSSDPNNPPHNPSMEPYTWNAPQ